MHYSKGWPSARSTPTSSSPTSLSSCSPGLTAFGGASQHEYLPRIEAIALRAHDLGVTFPPEVVERSRARGHSALLGPALLELTPLQRTTLLLRLSEATDLNAFERDAMQRPIRDTAGDLDHLRYLDALRAARLGAHEASPRTESQQRES